MTHNVLLISDSDEAGTICDALADCGAGRFHIEWVRNCAAALQRLAGGQPDTARAAITAAAAHDSPQPAATASVTATTTGIATAVAMAQAPSEPLAALLVDLFLPDSHGLETFERLLQAAPHLPLLIVSAPQHEVAARLAVNGGASDYILTGRADHYLLGKALCAMLERAITADLLFEQRERARIALDAVADAVMATDTHGRVTYLNQAAERMMGWKRDAAAGHAAQDVLRVFAGGSCEAACHSMTVAMRDDAIVGLSPNSVLARHDSPDAALEDSAAPVHDRRGHITGSVVVFHQASAERALSHRMSYLAQHDSLTGLPNRMLLQDRLSQNICLARRRHSKVALLYLDIDRFKQVNDSRGHEIGDRLLQSVAQRLRSCVRRSDTVSRQGGDEFVIVLAEVAQARDAGISAGKMLQALAAPHRIEGHELRVTASIGIVVYPDDGTEVDLLMKRADGAMYHAKERGRNNYQFFEPDLNVRALERQFLESGLRHALEHQEFALHYQPRINLRTGAIAGAEALLRWRHPQRGLILPAQFVPIAAACGAMASIGRWALHEACRQLKEWQAAGVAPPRIAVNVSAGELRDTGFVAAVRAILKETGLAARELELELTEAALMQDSSAMLEVLQSLKQLGLQLTLDDFGTGYSSLSHLKRFPIDILKIDRSFVRDLTSLADAGCIVSAVIGMGRNLGMQVVAEGVESREQLALLQQQSCPLGQGSYFSEPVCAQDFARLCGAEARARPEQATRQSRPPPAQRVVQRRK